MLLVTGASGFVGQHLLKFLNNHAPEVASDVLPVYCSTSIEGGIQVDLTDRALVAELFDRHEITAVVHLAAEARPAICESEPVMTFGANVTAVKNLLHASAKHNSHFLYASTDMVFAGRQGLYVEEDEPDPINNYGKQKAEAEQLVKQYRGSWCIVRPALIYGGEYGGKSSFLSWMLHALKSSTGSFYTDERRSPVWVHDLAKLITKLSSIRYEGIVHAGGLECLSRADFAELAADVWNIPRTNIKTSSLAADPASAWRPGSVCLSSENAHHLVSFHTTRLALQKVKEEDTL